MRFKRPPQIRTMLGAGMDGVRAERCHKSFGVVVAVVESVGMCGVEAEDVFR